MNITEYLSKIGFIPLTTIPLSNGKAYLCYKIVNYYGKEKLIFGIFIGGFDDEESYIKFITDTKNMHQNYEMVVNSVINEINNLKNLDLIKQYLKGRNYCYFITGKGIGGAIAADIATKLGDTHNIYCYTFGIPNVKGTSTHTYIKNIVNEDDLLPKIHKDVSQDGDVYNKSIYWDLIPEYRYYIESPNRYKGNYKKTNTIRNNLEDIKRMIDSERYISFINDEAKYLYSQIGGRITFDSYEIFNHTRDTDNYFIEEKLVEIEEFTETLTTANSTKAYWCLVKALDGYDSKYYYGKETYTDTIVSAFIKSEIIKKDSNEKTLLECIEEMGVWYVNHVATYNHKIFKNSTSRGDYYNKASEAARTYLKQYANITEPVDESHKSFTLKKKSKQNNRRFK